MSLPQALRLATVSLFLCATSAHAQLQLCFDDQVAYDPIEKLSWVTDYRSNGNGYAIGGPLESFENLPPGVKFLAAAMDVHGVTGWRIPTVEEYVRIFPHTGDCGIDPATSSDCTLVPGEGTYNPPWWNINSSHFQTSDCVDPSLTTCGLTPHFGIHGVTHIAGGETQGQGEAHFIDWYSEIFTMVVKDGNVCPATAVPSSTLPGRVLLIAALAGLTALAILRPRRIGSSKAH